MSSFLNPPEILKMMNLREDILAADFGSGSGGWVIPLAKILVKGKIWAIDVQDEMLSALKSKADAEKLFNIEISKKNLEQGSDIRENSLDLVLITNLLFQVFQKKEILSEAKNVLKPGGKLLIIDWIPDIRFGPKEERISSEDTIEMAKGLGLSFEKEFSASDYHWGLIFIKP